MVEWTDEETTEILVVPEYVNWFPLVAVLALFGLVSAVGVMRKR